MEDDHGLRCLFALLLVDHIVVCMAKNELALWIERECCIQRDTSVHRVAIAYMEIIRGHISKKHVPKTVWTTAGRHWYLCLKY